MKRIKRFSSVFFCGLLISCVFQFLTVRLSYSAVPTITSVTPETGATTSSTRVTITGENFEPGAKVSLLSGGPLLVGANDVSGYVHVSGKYAYVAKGRSGLKILDISNFSSPEIVGSINNIGSADKVYVYGDYAYVTVNSKEEFATSMLQVIDIRDPALPELAASIIAPGSIEYVSGDYAYLSSGLLTVVDISDPTSPEIVSSYDLPEKAYGVQVSGSYAYVTYVIPECCGYFGGAGLLVIDISDPTAPVTVGSYDTPGNAFDVYVSGNYAYVAAGQAGLQIIDISDPASPTFAGSVATFGSTYQNIYVTGSADDITGSVYSVYVADGYAYLVGEPGFLVVDVRDPTSPALVASYDTRGVIRYSYSERAYTYLSEFNVYVADDYAYVSDMEGLLLFDISNPANPAFTGTAQTSGKALSLHVSGDYAYVNSLSQDEFHAFLDLSAINVSDPSTPVLIASTTSDSFHFEGAFNNMFYGMYVSGNYAYLPSGQPGLQVFDISDPASLTLAGSLSFPVNTNSFSRYKTGSVYVSGNYAYLPFLEAGWEGGYMDRFWIVDISDPNTPTLTSFKMPAGTRGVYILNSLAYLASGGAGLLIIDISDPSASFTVGSCDTPGSAQSVYVSDHYAYIADGKAGLSVVDISDPTAPFLAGNYDTPGSAKRLHVSGNYAYIADGAAGLSVINISDPTSPFLADLVDTPHITNDVYASGGYAYLANGYSGFIVTATHDSVTDINVLNSTTITATFPADLPKGSYHVLVTNPGGQTEEAYLYNAFKADLFSAPEPERKCCMKHHRKRRNSKKE